MARTEVEHRALAGLTATAKATVLHEQQAWDDAVRGVTSAATRPVPLSALEARDATLASLGVQNILISGPYADVRLYAAGGALVAIAALPGVIPTPSGPIAPGPPTYGDPASIGTGTARQVSIPAGSGGRLVVDVDLSQLVGKPSDLGFGRTGAKFLVARDGLIVAGTTAVGTTLRAAENVAIAAAGRPATTTLFSPFFGRLTAESYEPIPGQDLGILVQQARAEVMGGADQLAELMGWAALAVGLLGATLAGTLGAILSRRGRRLAASEQRLVESERASRRRLEQVLDAIPIGVVVATPDGHRSYANREAEHLLGPDAGQDRGLFVVGTGRPYPASETPMARAINGETTHVDDLEVRGPDGTAIIEAWGTSVRSHDGSVELGVTALADISERRHAAERMQFLSTIAANMSEGVVLIRPEDSTIAYANDSYAAMFGYEPTELVGRSVRDLAAPSFLTEGLSTQINDDLRAGGGWRGEIHGRRKDGTSLWCAVTVTVIDHPTLGPAWIAVITDITARRLAEEAQARLASIVRASGDAILAKTLDGIVTSWNHGAEVLFGYSAAEVVGGPIGVLVPLERRNEEEELRGRVASGLGVAQHETVRLRKHGPPVDVSVTMSPIEDANGRITGIATICRDVTERNRVEAALLEREAELGKARDLAVEASRLKSDFLANMSHEIRTPMNAVIGLTGLLLDSTLTPVQRQYADAVRSAGEALLAIINDLLDFSKIEAGKLRLEPTDFDLRVLVEEVADFLATVAHGKGLELATVVHPDAPAFVHLDPGRLRQVLTNLVGNAIKFSDRGEVVVWVLVTGGTPETPTMRFEVADTGIGISPDRGRQLFQAFEQVDSSASRRYGGTGLGLAVSRQLVEMMGGEIGFESTLGAGSTFWFTIPNPVASGCRRPGDRLQDLQGLRVLVVDDNPAIRSIVGEQTTSWGAVTTLAEGGEEALARLRAAKAGGKAFDVALVDVGVGVRLPGMDGLALVRSIRADSELDATRLVLMGTPASGPGPAPGVDADVVAQLQKPLHEGDLHDCLARVSGRAGSTTTPPAREEPVVPRPQRLARLLVAEDNPVNQLVALGMLEQLGYRADVAANGSEVLDALARVDYAAVLMDCQMPEMDGYDATREIRRRQGPGRHTPVIAMTAAATQEDRDRCFEAEMDDYVSKPVRLAELGAALDRWVPAEPSRA